MKKILIIFLSLWMVSLSFAKEMFNNPVLLVPYEQVEIKPLFPGGISEFMAFVMKNFRAPEDEDFPVGVVQVSMVIDKTGKVTNVKIIKDVGTAGTEVKRVLANCPKWQPGRMKGEYVDVEYVFPITLK